MSSRGHAVPYTSRRQVSFFHVVVVRTHVSRLIFLVCSVNWCGILRAVLISCINSLHIDSLCSVDSCFDMKLAALAACFASTFANFVSVLCVDFACSVFSVSFPVCVSNCVFVPSDIRVIVAANCVHSAVNVDKPVSNSVTCSWCAFSVGILSVISVYAARFLMYVVYSLAHGAYVVSYHCTKPAFSVSYFSVVTVPASAIRSSYVIVRLPTLASYSDVHWSVRFGRCVVVVSCLVLYSVSLVVMAVRICSL